MPRRIAQQRLVLLVVACRAGTEGIAVIPANVGTKNGETHSRRTGTDWSAGRWAPELGCSNQFERLWSRPSESPIDFAKRFSLHNLRPWFSLFHSRYYSVDPNKRWLVTAGWALVVVLCRALLETTAAFKRPIFYLILKTVCANYQ